MLTCGCVKWKEAVVISKGRKREISVQRGCVLTDLIETGRITGTHQYTVW